MTTPRTIAVAGSTGFVGRNIVRDLLAGGCSVRALVRQRDKARRVLPVGNPKLTLVVGDVLESGRAEELVSGADACINCIGILREDRAAGLTFEGQHSRATRLLVKACEARPTQRFIQISALGVSEDGIAEYQRSKWESEQTVRLSSLEWTILRPGLIHGPESEFVAMAKSWTTGSAAPWIFLPYFRRMTEDTRVPLGSITMIDPVVQPVFIGDVTKAVLVCLERSETVNEIYNLGGGETIPFPDMLRFMRDHIPGSKTHLEPFGIPGKVASLAAKAAMLAGLGKLVPHDDGMPLMAAEDNTAPTEKVRKHLKFQPREFRESFQSYAHSL
jgi:NADH dehydrogenase